MSTDQKILRVAVDLVEALNKQADKLLPGELSNVVKTHSALAVGSSWIPIPGADVAAAAVSIWGMYVRINSKIGLSIKENVLKTIASGVATNLAAYGVGMAAASALKFIPGIGTIGSAIIMSALVYALTLASGYVYLKALLLLARKGNGVISEANLGEAVKEVLKESDSLKSFINEAKGDYKKNKS